mgnify:CR=1 FL=1
MNNEKKLRKALKPMIMAHMAKNPYELKEGLFDRVLDHIEGILQKSNTKNYKAKLASIAKGSPEGKAAVKNYTTKMMDLDKAMKAVEAQTASERS